MTIAPTTIQKQKVIEIRAGPQLFRWDYGEYERNASLRRDIDHLAKQVWESEIQFFKPHGAGDTAPKDCAYVLVPMLDFMNDFEHSVHLNKSPNQVGKTCHNVIAAIMRTIPCDPYWICFRKHGLVCPPWTGPKTLVLLGNDFGQVGRVMWPEIQRWMPDAQLPAEFRRGGPRAGGPNWDKRPEVTLACGSRVMFFSYDQKASTLAGVKADIALPDEQMPQSFWTELDERGRTRGGIDYWFGYTPHQIEGREDGGSNSFLEGFWDGSETHGHKVIRTRISVPNVPDYIYSKAQKQASYQKWVVEPKKTGNEAMIREGMARYYGIAQMPAGLFYHELTPRLHYIPWSYEDIKKRPGYHVRYVDYGFTAPTACIWAWISIEGDVVVYDGYYERGKTGYESAQEIVKRSGNTLRFNGVISNDRGNQQIETFTEHVPQEGGRRFEMNKLDWHCFSEGGQSGGGITIGRWFQMGGLNVHPSTTKEIFPRSQDLRILLRIDQNRKHLVTGEKGAPRLYICKVPGTEHLRWELEHCLRSIRKQGEASHNPREIRMEKDDHAIDALEYLASDWAPRLGNTGVRMEVITKR